MLKKKAKSLRQCTKCSFFRPAEEFGSLRNWCYECEIQYNGTNKIGYLYQLNGREELIILCEIQQQYKVKKSKRDPQVDKNSRLKRLYGIDTECWTQMRLLQENRCVICNNVFTEDMKHIHVDHDHKTGMVRDLLCSKCNMLLGWCNDSIDILQSAINYLQRHADVYCEVS